MSIGDGMDCSPQVPAARGVCVPSVMSYQVRHSILVPFVGSALPAFPGAESPRVWLLGSRVCSLLGYDEGQ
jgi:hypothetical protein